MNLDRAIDGLALPTRAHFVALGRDGIRYGLASILALACDVGVYALALLIAVAPVVAGVLGYSIGLFIHYGLSSGWVFPNRTGSRKTLPTFAKFAASGVMGLIMTAGVIGALTASGITGAFGAKAAAVGLSYVAVFLVRRRYVFAIARGDAQGLRGEPTGQSAMPAERPSRPGRYCARFP